MIPRNALSGQIETALGRSRAVALIGPRQCGKTTLARTFVAVDSANYFDLETRSMHVALQDLGLDHLAVVYPGERPYPLAEGVSVVPLEVLASGEPAAHLGLES
jgi:chloramphenicol 3-O-phosphotransferase